MADENIGSVEGSINTEITNPSVDQTDFSQSVSKWNPCHPASTLHRFFVLIFMCFLGFGSYFCYDNPGALQTQIMSDMHVQNYDYSLLYSLYSWPNVALSFFGGFLIDRWFGIRLGAIIFSSFIVAGQVVFASGALVNSFTVMILGRFIFGIGGESLAVTQNAYAVSWFKGKELNMVFGLQLSLARLGSTVNFDTIVNVYDYFAQSHIGYKCLGVTLFFALVTCILSEFCAFALAFFDWRAKKILNTEPAQTGEKVSITDAKDFSSSFWVITIICVAYYVAIFPFIGLGSVFFQRKYGYDPKGANYVDSIAYVISAVASPIFGFLVDKTGFNLYWLLIATVITLGSHALLCFTYLHPLVSVVFLGLSYSILACALWPMVSLLIPENKLGTAYGVMQSVQNLGLALITMAAGSIVDIRGYFILEIFFIAWVSLSIMSVMVLLVINERKKGILNLSVKARSAREKIDNLEDDEKRLLSYGSDADVSPAHLTHSQEEPTAPDRF